MVETETYIIYILKVEAATTLIYISHIAYTILYSTFIYLHSIYN